MFSDSLAFLFLAGPLLAAGMYSKSSPVLQVTAKTYDRLIAKSNHTSIVEFYAPWCGHCKNLKPAYEKAAASLAGIAKVAAVDCDEDSNKALCGSMGVQGFPTLKIIKPSKKPGGKPSVEDYQGARTAKGINDAVVDKIPNHVKRLKDEELDTWLQNEVGKPKALFFSDKGFASPLVKALAIDFLGAMDFGYMKSTETKAMEKFGVTSAPAIVMIPAGGKDPAKYNADMSKAAILKFLSHGATPNPDAMPEETEPKESKPKPSKSSKAQKPASKASAASEASSAASETLEARSKPTESPDPKVASESAQPIQIPVKAAPALAKLEDEAALRKACLHAKASTCVLAMLPSQQEGKAGDTESALTSLSEIAHKHVQRGAKIFPFYSVPDSNVGASKLSKALAVQAAPGKGEVIAINAKRGWWKRYDGANFGMDALETWIDSIRFGEVSKEKLPDGLIEQMEKEQAREDAAAPPPEDKATGDKSHDEL